MSSSLAFEQVWTDRSSYENAERIYHEKQGGVTCSKITLTPLADEVARARQRLINIKNSFDSSAEACTTDASAVCLIEKKFVEFTKVIQTIQDQLTKIDSRLKVIENKFEGQKQAQSCAIDVCKIPAKTTTTDEKADDDDVDLFASDEEDDAEAEKIKQARLAEYNAKKSKKPALIAKSSIVLDCKPWDDETDMKKMEEHVRSITMEGLLWGASKLVELAYGIKKLQISCVVEDDKVSVDELQEKIEGFEDYVQSVDIAAFNKI